MNSFTLSFIQWRESSILTSIEALMSASTRMTKCHCQRLGDKYNEIYKIQSYKYDRNVSEAGLFQEKTLMLGALSTLLSSTFWQISAIYLSLPVSGSHSIVSGLIGDIQDPILLVFIFLLKDSLWSLTAAKE